MIKLTRITIVLICVLSNLTLLAQETDYENGKKYIVGGLKISGLQTYNEQTVKTYTGLREGMPIVIPGEQISAIINKLWDLELFSDINFYLNKVEGDKAFIELEIIERPVLSEVKVIGIGERKVSDIVDDTDLKKGKKITKSLISNTKNYLENKYKDQGYLNAKVAITTKKDTSSTNAQQVLININKGSKVKINNIVFEGNENLKTKKLRKSLKKTKVSFPGRFWKKSKYIPEDYGEDL